MIARTILVVCLQAVLFCNIAFALDRNHFQYNMPLQTEGKHPVYQLELPTSVYQHIQTDAFNDIRVFNAEGAIVPHQLRTPLSRKVTTQMLHKVAFFPVRVPAGSSNNDLSFYITKNPDGTIVSLNSSRKTARDNINMYLVDATGLKNLASHMVIQWKPVRNTRVVSVVLESSNNLKHWASAGKATLVKLKYNGHSLNQNTIRISGYSKSKYYRLRWPDNPHGIAITGIKVSTIGREVTAIPARQTKEVTAVIETPVNAEKQFDYYAVDLQGMYPTDRLQINLPYNNSAVNARILVMEKYSYRTRHRRKLIEHVQARTLWNGTIYKLEINGKTLQNPAPGINPGHHRKFYIVLPKGALPPASHTLKVTASWLPQKLFFIAQGKGPYTMAYGASDIEPPAATFDKLEELLKSSHGKKLKYAAATAGTPVVVKDFKGKIATATSGKRSSRTVLWIVLVSGVLVLGGMIVLIVRQGKAASQ